MENNIYVEIKLYQLILGSFIFSQFLEQSFRVPLIHQKYYQLD